MTRREAEEECAERNREAADGPGVRWMAREESPGDWRAVRAVIPGLAGFRPIGPLKTSTEAPPHPEVQPDPRPLVNPNWGGPGF